MFPIQTDNPVEFKKRARKYKIEAKNAIKTCYHPTCSKPSINTHILQKNGILSRIAPERHLWKIEIDRFSDPYYQLKRKGIEKVFSFNGFCKNHDNDLFKEIESGLIDFSKYDTFLKFSLRALYNEINRKEVIIKTYRNLFKDYPEYYSPIQEEWLRQKQLGVEDFRKVENRIWNDLNFGTKNYIFNFRELPFVEICASGFYTYETSEEIRKYIRSTGKEYPEYTNIFINLFPYGNKLILQMGYPKHMEKTVKPYFNQFFKLSEKKVFRMITNILIFSEIWVFSDKFHNKFVKGNENLFLDAFLFTSKMTNQRMVYDLNFLDHNFIKKFNRWHKKNI